MTSSYSNSGSNFGPDEADASDVRMLQNDSERFRLLVENSHDIIVEISEEREILYVSPNVISVLGFSPEELVGTGLFSRVHADDLVNVQAQFDHRSGRATCRYRHKNGSWRWFESTGREFINSDGEARRVLVARDITAEREAAEERERLETELARAEKLNALGTLAGGMAHDFNNLLTAILAYASLARTRAGEPDVRDALNQILRAGDRAKNIAQQILDFSGQQRTARTYVDLTAVAQEVLQLLRHIIPAKIEVVADLSHDCGAVFANGTQLHQVLVNLCHNAVHAMRDTRGRLVVRVAQVEVDAAFAKAHPGARVGSYVGLSVIDNGHGMDPATQRRIFEPFFTTKAAGVGTGLGLAVVQRIVRDHDGVIHVTSLPGEGTVFQVLLPAKRDRTSAQPPRHLP